MFLKLGAREALAQIPGFDLRPAYASVLRFERDGGKRFLLWAEAHGYAKLQPDLFGMWRPSGCAPAATSRKLAGMAVCAGTFRALLLYDVADELDLNVVRKSLGAEKPGRRPEFKLPTPGYVRFENPPVVEASEPVRLPGGEQFEGRLKYFDYGVVSLELELPFEAEWDELIRLSNRWIDAPDLERAALEIVRKRTVSLSRAARRPYADWLEEIYYIVHLREARDGELAALTGSELLARHGPAIAQIVRGELCPLSAAEEREVLGSSMSYYPTDLLVTGWMAALVYDNYEGALATIQLLEYANTQLLEYRRYDEVLTRVLKHAYDSLEHGGFSSRWKRAGEATRLNTLRLDITELTERTDNAIKFLSDMFYARAYQLAAAKIGVNDYRRLVDEKQRTAGELYQFMVNEFREARSFVLEMVVIIILIIDITPASRQVSALTHLSQNGFRLRCHHARPTSPLTTAQPALERFHVKVNDRSDVKGEKLGDQQTSDHRHS